MIPSFIYHTDIQPTDQNGTVIKPLDLVVIGDIAEFNSKDPKALKDYDGTIGLVNYEKCESTYCYPYIDDQKTHPGWVNEDGSLVHVKTRRHDRKAEFIQSDEFWLPVKSIKKIPFNSLVMNIFVEYPWLMGEEDGPGTYPFVRKGIPEYDYLTMILDTPLEELQQAHDAAMSILDN